MMMIYLYQVFTTGIFFLVFPFVLLMRALGFGDRLQYQRFGIYDDQPPDNQGDGCRVWIHAASVGEVKVAENIIQEMRAASPHLNLIISTTTRAGQTLARETFGDSATCIFAPLDFLFCIRRALNAFQPDMAVFVETEIWPNWLHELQKRSLPAVFVNGRISERSIRIYIIMKSMFAPLLANVARFSMISRDDADRIQRMGAFGDRVVVNGNAKFDRMNTPLDSRDMSGLRRLLNLQDTGPVFVAGSTRPSEEEIILDVYGKICKDFPDLMLIIAPRHVARSNRIEKLVTEREFSYQVRTDLDKQERTAPVLILNTIGELQNIYGLADVVFCGGSLAPFGGHNILEPAAWGKPVLYGPFMEDFKDAASLLTDSGGGIQVTDGEALFNELRFLLSHPQKAREVGEAAEKAVISNRGAAKKHADIILGVLIRRNVKR